MLAVMVGVLAAYIAKALLALIAFFTNLFFFQRLSLAPVSPAGHHLGILSVLVPVIGCLVIGILARYGSERIRGHGIPEALEAILIRGSRIEPRVALLKPISSAISIGSGGPFGAEGPIIMTGGAFGSMIAQLFHLTAAERKTLLVAGAAAGMSATFASPVAAVLLSVELLLFELKPRSLVPVALASAAAAVVRRYILGAGPLFPVPDVDVAAATAPIDPPLLYLRRARRRRAVGDAHRRRLRRGGRLRKAEAALDVVASPGRPRRRHRRAHLPAGARRRVRSDQALLLGGAGVAMTVRLMLVKATIWSVSLGSGTSGGVLAPLLMMGSALGVLETHFLPAHGAGFWPIVSMAAILAGTMRAPLTAMIFAVELSGRFGLALPILTAGMVAHLFTVLVLRRSILTEKVARRGFHLTREYSVDPLEILFVREVMLHEAVVLPFDTAMAAFVAHSDEPLRAAVHRMAEMGLTQLPVIDQADPPRLVGLVTLKEALTARVRHLEEEGLRERVLPLRAMLPFPRFRARHADDKPEPDREAV